MTIHAEASSKEMRTQNTIEPNIYYQFTVRYQAGISNAMRIKYRNQFFDIIKIVNVREENTELRITARLGSEGI
jgi:head-tail adaptor